MSSLIDEFRTPDPARPLRGKVPPWGPWCELIDFKPPALTAERVVGRVVDGIHLNVGTYGMGGPGFFGLRLGDEWLVVAIWGASSWVAVEGRIVEDIFWDTNGTPRPWVTGGGDELSAVLVGQPVTSFELGRCSLTVGIGSVTLSIAESPDGRPILEGNRQPRAFEADDDLRRSVFLSPTTEIWV